MTLTLARPKDMVKGKERGKSGDDSTASSTPPATGEEGDANDDD